MRKTQHDVNMSTLHDFKDELWFEICGVLSWLCEKYDITPPSIAMREKNEWDRYMKVHGEDADMDKFEELYKKNTVMVNELEELAKLVDVEYFVDGDNQLNIYIGSQPALTASVTSSTPCGPYIVSGWGRPCTQELRFTS